MTPRRLALATLVLLVVASGGVLAYDAATDWLTPDPPLAEGGDGGATPTEAGGNASGNGTHADWTTVTVLDGDGSELGTVSVRVADTFGERYTGLSNTGSLGPDEGMLFVHGSEGEHAYVMRDMDFPIDIVFVGANRTITAIHHAEPEEPPLTRYRGTGKWVLEVPYNWTTDHGVEVGDSIRIQHPDGTPTNGTAG